MLNKKIWLVILVMILIFGMAVTEVEAQSNKGGEFTLTNIPAKYDGKYVLFSATDKDGIIEVYGDEKLSRISDGKVIIPLWILRPNGKLERYYGSHSLEVQLEIYDSPDIDEMSEMIDVIFFRDQTRYFRQYREENQTNNMVNFSNGSSTKTYNARSLTY